MLCPVQLQNMLSDWNENEFRTEGIAGVEGESEWKNEWNESENERMREC